MLSGRGRKKEEEARRERNEALSVCEPLRSCDGGGLSRSGLGEPLSLMSSSSLQLHHHYVQTDSTATECAVLLLISLYSFLSLLQASECYLWLADQGLECSAANDRAAAFDSPFISRLLLPPPPIHSFNCNLLFIS